MVASRSGKADSFLSLGHSRRGNIVNRHAEAVSYQSSGTPSVAKGQIFVRQSLFDQMPVVRSFEESNAGNAGRKVSAGGGQNPRFADLTTQLVPQSARMCKGGDPQ